MAINSQCIFCWGNIEFQDIIDLPVVDKPTPAKSPHKRMLEDYLLIKEVGTPLQEADHVRTLSQEKRQQRQKEQGKRMKRMQGNKIVKLVALLGAAVAVKVDHQAVPHVYGILGVIYKITDAGAALVVTESGLLCNGTR
jgi:hypothetical protein